MIVIFDLFVKPWFAIVNHDQITMTVIFDVFVKPWFAVVNHDQITMTVISVIFVKPWFNYHCYNHDQNKHDSDI